MPATSKRNSSATAKTGLVDSPYSEDEWSERIREGDYRAFEDLFRIYYSELLQFARLFTQTPESAEGVVQETMASIWEHREKWNPHGSMRAYLYGAVKRQAGQLHRRREVRNRWFRREGLHGKTPVEKDVGPDEDLRLNDLRGAIENAISELPERRRLVFVLSRNHGLTYAEIGALLNISVKTVDTQIGRSIKYLRKKLAYFLNEMP